MGQLLLSVTKQQSLPQPLFYIGMAKGGWHVRQMRIAFRRDQIYAENAGNHAK